MLTGYFYEKMRKKDAEKFVNRKRCKSENYLKKFNSSQLKNLKNGTSNGDSCQYSQLSRRAFTQTMSFSFKKFSQFNF